MEIDRVEWIGKATSMILKASALDLHRNFILNVAPEHQFRRKFVKRKSMALELLSPFGRSKWDMLFVNSESPAHDCGEMTTEVALQKHGVYANFLLTSSLYPSELRLCIIY